MHSQVHQQQLYLTALPPSIKQDISKVVHHIEDFTENLYVFSERLVL